MAATMAMTRVLCRLQRVKQLMLQWMHPNQPPGLHLALAGTELNQPSPSSLDPRSVLESIMDSTLWAVPKHRRTLEKRLMRKHGRPQHFDDAIPKRNIVACLDCGNWHESHTICGHCYQKVYEETKRMKEAMGDDLKYNTPRSEISVLYEGENVEEFRKGNYIIEMDKPRPSWFPRQLLTRAKKDT